MSILDRKSPDMLLF